MSEELRLIDWLGETIIQDPGDGGYIWSKDKDGGCQMIAEVRGWGAIQNLFKPVGDPANLILAESFQDELAAFIVEALNEKLERDRMK